MKKITLNSNNENFTDNEDAKSFPLRIKLMRKLIIFSHKPFYMIVFLGLCPLILDYYSLFEGYIKAFFIITAYLYGWFWMLMNFMYPQFNGNHFPANPELNDK